MKTWRERAREIIVPIINEFGITNRKTLKWALCDAYPWGEKKGWPYVVWLDEIKKQIYWREKLNEMR